MTGLARSRESREKSTSVPLPPTLLYYMYLPTTYLVLSFPFVLWYWLDGSIMTYLPTWYTVYTLLYVPFCYGGT